MEALDLDRKHLNARHLGVEERHYLRERVGNAVGHEEQPQALRREVRGYILPEAVHVRLSVGSQQGGKLVSRLAAPRFGLPLECVAQLLRRPGLRGMRRILEQLSDDRASYLGVRASLHLRQGRHRILIDDQVIDRPPGGFARSRSNALFAGDEDPAARVAGSDLLSVEQFRMLGDQGLELGLGRELRLFERFEIAVISRRVDAFGHGEFLRGSGASAMRQGSCYSLCRHESGRCNRQPVSKPASPFNRFALTCGRNTRAGDPPLVTCARYRNSTKWHAVIASRKAV